MKKKLFVFLIPILLITISLFPRKENKELVSNTDNLVSFTVDGVESKTMPTKGSGYIANKITCKNGSIITFDNDNYIIEVEKLESADACKIDFSKEKGSNTVTVTISDTSKIDSTSKTTTEGGKVVFYLTGEPESITGGEYTLSSNKLIVNNIISNINLNITMSKTLYDQLLADKTTRLTRTNFNAFSTSNTKTLYKSIENNTTVYYFAGNATDNWVKFGKHTNDVVVYRGYNQQGSRYQDFNSFNDCNTSNYNSDCTKRVIAKSGEPIYWRIIRTNADGSIKLLYHGSSTTSTDAYLGFSSYSSENSTMSVGYMYGTSGSLENNRLNTNSSIIKDFLDTWYQKNLLTNYDRYLSDDAIYCNDRNLANGYNFSLNALMYYKAYDRLYNTQSPTYNCTNEYDSFSGNNPKAKLDYPIALMTADEASFAGGYYNSDSTPYYYYNSNNSSSIDQYSFWTMTPTYSDSSESRVYYVYKRLASSPVAPIFGDLIRPVISIKGNSPYKSGDGSASNPYEIEMN